MDEASIPGVGQIFRNGCVCVAENTAKLREPCHDRNDEDPRDEGAFDCRRAVFAAAQEMFHRKGLESASAMLANKR